MFTTKNSSFALFGIDSKVPAVLCPQTIQKTKLHYLPSQCCTTKHKCFKSMMCNNNDNHKFAIDVIHTDICASSPMQEYREHNN